MPENPLPATQPEAGAAAGEFNFTKPESETPRIKKRSLKAKPAGLIKPTSTALPAARELEREAPPLSADQVVKPTSVKTEEIIAKASPKAAEVPVAPTRSTPNGSPTPKIATTVTPTASATSPHGTRPATLYYSSPTRKAETPSPSPTASPSPMKTIPSASSPSSSTSAATSVASTPRVATTTASGSRPSPTVDYRANVERQSREQKSVGSILSYIVYGLITLFVISAGLAIYGADVIFKQLHEQSSTVADLDAHYTKLTSDLSAKLTATQDTLTAAQSQITRQQDVILHQQEQLNQLLTSSTANDSAIKAEKAARAQETATLRSRVKELEYRTSVQKY